MKTVHLIGNAHLDPVWLWHKSNGIDAVLATTRSVCDRLDEYPEFVFTCSASWFHEQVRAHDPELFARVVKNIESGRWRLVGGMVIQPDCNLPIGESFRRQLEYGQEYFRTVFNKTATVGYNVDSFGHTAWLPSILREFGMGYYVFMRPMPREKELPARVFRWQSPEGSEVVTFRIGGTYATNAADIATHIRYSLEELPPDVDHTMCFFGCGDHGGGPTRAQIEWLMEHRGDFEGVELKFSHPEAFFEAISGQVDSLPIVRDELQHHAVGCYSVERRIKLGARRAEYRLLQAEHCAKTLGNHVSNGWDSSLRQAWETVLFNQFHDILGGTCLAPAMNAAAGELVAAEGQAEDLIRTLTRRFSRGQAQPGTHKIAVFNASSEPFEGIAEHEPFLEFRERAILHLFDEKDQPVAMQEVEPLALCGGMRRIVFPLSVPPREWRFLRLDAHRDEPKPNGPAPRQSPCLPTMPFEKSPVVINSGNATVDRLKALRAKNSIAVADGWTMRLEVYNDPTDTWSHSAVNSFKGEKAGEFAWDDDVTLIECGPLRHGYRLQGTHDRSQAWCRVLVVDGDPFISIRISVVWSQVRQLLQLTFKAPGKIDGRIDLVSGGPLERSLDGLEYPLGGGMAVTARTSTLSIAAPEAFSCGVDEKRVWFTMLRSPYAAHHDPVPAPMGPLERIDQPATDQGRHDFEIQIKVEKSGEIATVAQRAERMMMPLVIYDLTG